MPKLTRSEIATFDSRLKKASPPTQFAAIVDELRERLGFWALVQNSPFREAYVADAFARFRGAATVCLGSDPPDMVVSGDFDCCVFEIVETFPEGRKRSDEYRAFAEAEDKQREFGEGTLSEQERALFAAVQDPEEDWEARTHSASGLLRAAAERKAARDYPAGWGLIIKLDLGGFVHSEDAVLANMIEPTKSAGAVFQEVWVLWGERLILTWRLGEAQPIARVGQ